MPMSASVPLLMQLAIISLTTNVSNIPKHLDHADPSATRDKNQLDCLEHSRSTRFKCLIKQTGVVSIF